MSSSTARLPPFSTRYLSALRLLTEVEVETEGEAFRLVPRCTLPLEGRTERP